MDDHVSNGQPAAKNYPLLHGLLRGRLTPVFATLLGWRNLFPDLDFKSDNFHLLPIFLPFSQSFQPTPAGSDCLCEFSRSPQWN